MVKIDAADFGFDFAHFDPEPEPEPAQRRSSPSIRSQSPGSPQNNVHGVEHTSHGNCARATGPTRRGVLRAVADELPRALSAAVRRVVLRVTEPFSTTINAFGLFRVFPGGVPAHDPDQAALLEGLCATYTPASGQPRPAEPSAAQIHPYPNKSAVFFADWFRNSGDLNTVTSGRAGVLDLSKIDGFDWRAVPTDAEFKSIDRILSGDLGSFGDGWKSHTVPIEVPRGTGQTSATIHIAGLQTRSLVKTFVHHLETDASTKSYHWLPQSLYHRSRDGRVQSIQSEVWNSPRFRRLHNEVQQQNANRFNDGIPCQVLALMPGSDATQLAQFGSASAWPGYMMYGNCSKYLRASRSAHAIHHVVSFPKVLSIFIFASA